MARQRIDQQRIVEVELGRRAGARVEVTGLRHGQVQPLGQRAEPGLVHEIVDEPGVGHDEAKGLAERPAVPRDEQQFRVTGVVQDRRRRLFAREGEKRLDLARLLGPGVISLQDRLREAREADGVVRRRHHSRGDPGERHGAQHVRVAHHAGA